MTGAYNHSVVTMVIDGAGVAQSTHAPPATSLEAFYQSYGEAHGYIVTAICVFGIIANVLNIIVLTQRSMVTSTNKMLTSLAVTDMLIMVIHLPAAIYRIVYSNTYPSENWRYFFLVKIVVAINLHNIAMWLTVAMATFRYIIVCHHTRAARLCNIQRVKTTIALIVLAVVLVCVPNDICYKVVRVGGHGNRSEYDIDLNVICRANDQLLYKINTWIHGAIMKVLSCVLLTILSALLIVALTEADRRRARLLYQGRRTESIYAQEHNRTTAMLVVIVACFVVTELPQGVLSILSGTDAYYQNMYEHLGDFMDLLVLVNSAVNFILYCIMSRQFRETFHKLFCLGLRRRHDGAPRRNGVTQYTGMSTVEKDCITHV